MSSTGFPADGVSCQFSYVQSIPGVLKLIELLCDLLAVILDGAAPTYIGYSGHKGFFLFVAILALIVTLIIFTLAILNIQNLCMKDHWPLIEVIWSGFIALLYFIASIVIATIAKYNGAYGAAAFFGFAAFIVYVADAVYQFRMRSTRALNQQAQQYAPNPSQQYMPDPSQNASSRPPNY